MILKSKKTKAFRSLWVTLAIAFLTLSAVVLIIASSLNIYFSFKNQQKLITDEQRFIAQNAAISVKDFVQKKLDLLRAATAITNLAVAPQEEQKLVLEKLLGAEPAFRQLLLLNPQEQELARISRLSNLVSKQFTKRVSNRLFADVRSGKIYIGSVYIDEVTSEPLLVMAVPVKDIFSDFNGILLAEVNLKFMWDLVGGIKIGNKGLAYVVDKKGNLIASGDISRVLKGENLVYLNEVNEFVRGDVIIHKDSAEIVRGIKGNKVVANHAHLGTPDWAVVVELPVLEAYETVITTLITSGLIILLSFALAIIAGIYLSKRITKPIIALRDAAIRIGEGRLDTRIEIKKKDEIGDLAAAFNQMTQHLQRTTTSIDNLNQEITVRKKVEAALLKGDERFKQVAESAGDWIWEIDAQGRYTYSNTIVEKVLGYTYEQVIGKYFYDFFLPEEREELKRKAFEGFSRKATFKSFLNRNVRKDGQIVTIETNGVPVIGEGGKLLGYRGADRDITERKKAEQRQAQLLQQLEKTNQELRNLIYLTSHDLKTPLRGIKTLTDWISTDYADKFDDEGKEKIKLLMSRTDRMYNLIGGILRYSRVGSTEEEKVLVNLNEIVSDVIDMIAPPENISITVENELPVIKCERILLIQVFQNLLSNAVKYMDKPKGLIKVGCVEEDGFWKFSVSDNGPGIEERNFERIFKIFQTLMPRDKFESTGIGLTIVKKIIDMYGGKIWLQSTLGKGTTFFFILPKQKDENFRYATDTMQITEHQSVETMK
jgi:two-component system sensor kinase FixL